MVYIVIHRFPEKSYPQASELSTDCFSFLQFFLPISVVFFQKCCFFHEKKKIFSQFLGCKKGNLFAVSLGIKNLQGGLPPPNLSYPQISKKLFTSGNVIQPTNFRTKRNSTHREGLQKRNSTHQFFLKKSLKVKWHKAFRKSQKFQ